MKRLSKKQTRKIYAKAERLEASRSSKQVQEKRKASSLPPCYKTK